jgi:hypothetical protein
VVSVVARLALYCGFAASGCAVGRAEATPRDGASVGVVTPTDAAVTGRACRGSRDCGGYDCICESVGVLRDGARAIGRCTLVERHGGLNCIVEGGRVRHIHVFDPASE